MNRCARVHTVSEQQLTQYYNSLKHFRSRGYMVRPISSVAIESGTGQFRKLSHYTLRHGRDRAGTGRNFNWMLNSSERDDCDFSACVDNCY